MKFILSILGTFLSIFLIHGTTSHSSPAPLDIQFDIILDSFPKYRSGMDYLEYIHLELLAIVKQTNNSDDTLELFMPDLIIDEVLESRQLNGDTISLGSELHYQIMFNPNWEDDFFYLNPNETIIDTTDLSVWFSFDTTGTFLIRVKDMYGDIENDNSNWDTLVIY